MTQKKGAALLTQGGERRGYRHAHHIASAAGRQGPVHGRIIAGGSVWAKTVRGSIHLLRKPTPSWACDQADALLVWQLGVVWLCIHDLEMQRRYWALLRDLLENAVLFDRGHGPQLALPLTAFHIGETAPKQLSVQLGLF